jgi:recombination protein RecR
MYFTPPLAKLIEEFQRFPGVGPKSAQRMAFFVLSMSQESVHDFAFALTDAKDRVKACSLCFHLSSEDPCELCKNEKRDRSTMCVVAESRDVIALERSREYKGVYHVLTGLSQRSNSGDQPDYRRGCHRALPHATVETCWMPHHANRIWTAYWCGSRVRR